jgi:hypothetical protein
MSYMELKFSRQLNDYTELHQSQPSALNGVPTEETSSSAQIALGGDAVKPWPGPSNTAATTFFIKYPGYALKSGMRTKGRRPNCGSRLSTHRASDN